MASLIGVRLASYEILSELGDFPVWGPEGRELYFMSPDSNLHAVDTRTLGASTSSLVPALLFKSCPATQPGSLPSTGVSYMNPYDTRDGEHFLFTCRIEPAGRFRVLTNWSPPK